MNISPDSVRALERHFVGALSLPARLWLDAAPLAHVVVSGGDALRGAGDGCAIDFGVVESPGAERQIVRIASTAEMTLLDAAPWLAARWTCAGGAAELELVAGHDVLKQTEFTGAVRVAVGAERVELLARMTARRTHPLGAFDFHGAAEPRGFDFGIVDPLAAPPTAYGLSFDSLTSVPLTIAFSDLPAWLTFDVDGHRRAGPVAGRFFERNAPFEVSIGPNCTVDLIGTHQGALRMETNDPRPALRAIDIRFSVRLEPAGPFVRALPERVRVATARPMRTDVRLENWGRAPARISAESLPSSVQMAGRVVSVPAAHGGCPGAATLPLRLFPARLSSGAQSVPLTLDVDGGAPLQIELPVQVAPAALRKPRRAVVPAAVAALFALLALTIVIVLYLRVLS